MDVFLLRHAETENNRNGELAAGSNDPLTQHGHSQAQSIIERLLSFEIEGILCSPYPRALDTIRPFAEVAKTKIEVHPCLAEGHLLLGESPAREEPKYCLHASGYYYPQENEAPGAFMGRVAEAHKLIETQSFSRILVVTHGHVLRELLNSILALPNKTRFPHDNCGLTHMSLGGVNIVRYINRPMSSV
ncbi:histidine phosphatase family protein [Halomonas sp. ML-15]|uniref:histidine phosphatase family protein n=1 Tax=Halomonas sp. ML-15 TaxID=2773305 RepID=UPI0017477C68|nr:histidine phosphatase family protein [Halomonas sp. ML-15]MBD3896886.1 histidine phosphatase family protein [Halomonas sp. ML-15]